MNYELAGFGQRFVALLIDVIILGVVNGIITGIFGQALGGALGLAIGVGYYWYFWTRNHGQTPGKSAMSIRVIKVDGSELNDADAIIRYVGYIISSFVLLLGFFWVLFDSESQGWHDKIASTYVVKID